MFFRRSIHVIASPARWVWGCLSGTVRIIRACFSAVDEGAYRSTNALRHRLSDTSNGDFQANIAGSDRTLKRLLAHNRGLITETQAKLALLSREDQEKIHRHLNKTWWVSKAFLILILYGLICSFMAMIFKLNFFYENDSKDRPMSPQHPDYFLPVCIWFLTQLGMRRLLDFTFGLRFQFTESVQTSECVAMLLCSRLSSDQYQLVYELCDAEAAKRNNIDLIHHGRSQLTIIRYREVKGLLKDGRRKRLPLAESRRNEMKQNYFHYFREKSTDSYLETAISFVQSSGVFTLAPYIAAQVLRKGSKESLSMDEESILVSAAFAMLLMAGSAVFVPLLSSGVGSLVGYLKGVMVFRYNARSIPVVTDAMAQRLDSSQLIPNAFPDNSAVATVFAPHSAVARQWAARRKSSQIQPQGESPTRQQLLSTPSTPPSTPPSTSPTRSLRISVVDVQQLRTPTPESVRAASSTGVGSNPGDEKRDGSAIPFSLSPSTASRTS